MAFMACTFIGVSKGFTIGCIVLSIYTNPTPYSYQLTRAVSFLLGTALFIPQFLIAIFSTIGFSFNSIKTIFYHPELLILPTGIRKVYIYIEFKSNT